MKRIAVIAALLLGFGTIAAQETRYVTDILQLGLHQAEDTSDSPFRNLVSGTELEVLESTTNYARVRTPDGDEGWVRAAFLVAEQPAQARLAEAEARVAELEAAASEMSALVETAESELAAISASRTRLEALEEENARYLAQIELYRGSLPWPWVAGALAVALLAGFVAGWSWLDAAIRRRHGGFRVY